MLAGPLGLTVGFAGAAAAARRFANHILEEGAALDAIGKLSTRTGIATRDLMAMQHAAGQSGVSTEQLTTALQAFNKRTGEAAMGTGRAIKAFDHLGISVDEFIKLPTIERFTVLADRINAMTNETEQAAVAAALFSDAGKGPMLNMLALGADGIEELTKQARMLGATLNDETVKAIERANDAMAVQKLRAKGLSQQLTGELIPAVGYMTEKWEELFEAFGVKDENSTLVRTILEGGLGAAPKPVRFLGRGFLAGGDILKQEERSKLLNKELTDKGLNPKDQAMTQKKQLTTAEQSRGLLQGIYNGISELTTIRNPIVDHF